MTYICSGCKRRFKSNEETPVCPECGGEDVTHVYERD